MTKNEGAIISAYTGKLIGNFDDFHAYAEKKIGRPILTFEFSREKIWKELKEKTETDFLKVVRNLKEEL